MAYTLGVYTYDDLVDNLNPDPVEEWITVTIPNLQKGALYFLPVYFWAKESRRVMVEFFRPGSDEIESKLKTIIESGELSNRGTWTCKRYKLNSKRHDGIARLRFGWPGGSPEAPLRVSFGAIERKGSKRQKLIDAGCCPECGKPGSWITMAMVCPEHGAFLGA